MNPFKAPSIAEILKNAQVRVKETPKETAGLKIWEKMTAASRPHTTKRTKRSPPTQPSPLPPQGDGERQETAAEFFEKKRDIFWIQMNINTKKAQVAKIDELKKKRQAAISAAQKKMADDKIRLKAYYTANDAKSAESLAKLDAMKNENARLTEQTKSLRAQLVASELVLEDLEKKRAESLALKMFLDNLNKGRPFNDGKEMMEAFANLEEQNLQLILEIQQTQEQVEEQENALVAAKVKMENGMTSMKAANDATRNEIERIKEASGRLEASISGSRSHQSMAATLKNLQSQVAHVNSVCGLDGAGQDTIQMLTNIEKVAETVLKKLEKSDAVLPEFASKLEKAKEKERRRKLRADRVAEEKHKSEQRSIKSLERAMRPVEKMKGKPIMFRSEPIKVVREVEDVTNENDEAQRLSNIFGFYLDEDKIQWKN